MKPLRLWTKFFLLLTLVLVAVYFIGDWYLTENPEVIWLVPELWVIYGAVASAIAFVVCYLRKK